ncbi:stalk domain-containing protein [Paenibacillus sp. MZ04-78.2]|uniref:stalk domain-containing protein n=1 Tax=Paenibacillus sp. MZ04-78.2 TaxID=2962034 RepID=UPI0020B836C9|nr:stalk domain-containing protein [Paenibacillus sp. MZ04-78.2]MCP3776065.1 stalk domain-containing protein [Paenibacillus sp. MZ04-78.2]
MNSIARPGKSLMLLSLALMLWCIGLTLPISQAQASSYSFDAAPKGTVGVTKPNLTFYFDTDLAFAPSSYSMTLNGQSVPASYDQNKGTFTYTPDNDLAPGNYNVKMSIIYPNYKPIEQSWSFTVAKNAVSRFETPTSEDQSGLAAVNDYRVLYGLPQLQMNERLFAMAKAHAKYLDANKIAQSEKSQESLHDQNPNKTGFFGQSPRERAAFYGYSSKLGEDVAYHAGSIGESVDVLFDAPYHRSPFLSSDAKEVGVAKVGDYTVIEFGFGSSENSPIVVSPADGERYVPTSFDGNEAPDPLRMHTSGVYPVGYPIMAQYSGENVDKIKLLSAELTDNAKQKVDLFANSPDNDDKLTNAVILLPRKPLQADQTYLVKLSLQVTKKDGTTATESKEWNFTTEPLPQLGKTKLHRNASDYLKQAVTVLPIQRKASFGLDDSNYSVDGVSFPMRRTPVIVDGSSYLYIRDLAAALGANVDWDEQQRAAVYTKGTLKVTLHTTKNAYEVNGDLRQTDTPARLVGDNTMVPVRLLAEVLGAKVEYAEATRTVKITY